MGMSPCWLLMQLPMLLTQPVTQMLLPASRPTAAIRCSQATGLSWELWMRCLALVVLVQVALLVMVAGMIFGRRCGEYLAAGAGLVGGA